jgi:YD repeat-containing protein
LPNGSARVVYQVSAREKREAYYDADERPFVDSSGLAGVHVRFDLLGRESEVIYLDAEGAFARTKNGVSRILSAYDERGNLVEQRLFDVNAQLALTILTEYDELQRPRVERYLGPAYKPATVGGPAQHITEFEYDDVGRLRAMRYRDQKKHWTKGIARAATDRRLCWRWVAEYDEAGRRKDTGRCEQEAPKD